ncbi:MAG TPA: terminase gpA endonuclease subunit [Planctomycetota bacterium]|nr:terminase gpA endonuclease subunit [Planctomycetota bacterium]
MLARPRRTSATSRRSSIPGCLSLFGRDPAAHQLLAEHITAETCVKVSAQGRVVDEWKWKESRPDNHWLDCLVGCAVAASMLGATLPGTSATKRKKRERVDFGEWQRGVRDGKA